MVVTSYSVNTVLVEKDDKINMAVEAKPMSIVRWKLIRIRPHKTYVYDLNRYGLVFG